MSRLDSLSSPHTRRRASVPSEHAFLDGGGEAGALMRAHDWAASPLGPAEGWPQSLRAVASLLLNSKFPMFLAWGPDLTFFYNDAYAPMLGAKHPFAMGRRFQDIWDDIWDDIVPLVDRALSGEATFHENLPLTMLRKGFEEETYFTFSYSPVRDESGTVAGLFCATTETTDKVLADRRLAFQLEFRDRIRDLADPVEVTTAAAGALGRHLKVARAGYGEIDPAGDTVVVERDWTDGRVASLAGEARLLDGFGPAIIAELRAGRTLRVADCQTDPRTAGEGPAAAWASIGARALIVVPLAKEGRLAAILYLHEPLPRRWTDAEAALAEDIAERTWDAVERTRAEAALRASEARVSGVIEGIREAFVLLDRDFRVRQVNPEVLRLEKRPASEILGKIHWEAWPGTETSPIGRLYKRAMQERVPVDLDHRYAFPDGREAWIEMRAYPLDDGLAIFYRDVTDRKRAEAALRESEDHYRHTVELNPQVPWTAGPDGQLDHVSKRWLEWTGTTGLGATWGDAVHPEDLGPSIAAWTRSVSTGEPYDIEHRIRLRGGAYHWMHSRAFPRRDEAGRIVKWYGTTEDVELSKAAADSLMRSEERFRSLVEATTAVVWTTDAEGAIVTDSPSWAAFTGQAESAYEGWGWLDAVHPDDRDRSAAIWRAALQARAPYESPYRLRRHDGEYRATIARAIPIVDGDGRIREWIGANIDVTEQTRAEEHQTLLIHELNHRVKNTLATVQSIAAQTLRNAPTMEQAREAFEGRLLALSRAHDVLTRENWEGAGLREIVEQALAPYASRREGRLQLAGRDVRLAPRMALALAMALQELATNAVKYGALSGDIGEIEIAWKLDRRDGARVLRLRWQEKGGPPVAPPQRRGFGSRLIERSLAQDLDGEVRMEFAPGGVVCTIDAPVP